jgi:acetyltransferase-like isoleucine patch superfamily enzyme
MAYLTQKELEEKKFKKLGKNVKISDKACIYNASEIELNDNCRIDDFCVLSGKIIIGRFNHITPMCLIAGGIEGVFLDDFCTLAYGVKVFSQSDDYSGETLVNSLIPKKFKAEKFSAVHLQRHVVVGASATILPGITIETGCSVGACTLVTSDLKAWGIYAGIPAKRIKERSKNLLLLEEKFLKEFEN